jgi:hypothetical protein
MSAPPNARKTGGLVAAIESCCDTVMAPVRTYSTNKEVTLLDRKLGMLYFAITSIVMSYVIGVRLYYEKGYKAVELSNGVVGIKLEGTGYTKTKGLIEPADIASLVKVGPEGDALFLPTRWVTWTEQRRGNCTNADEPCSADSDCRREPPLAPGKCEGQLCERYQWCSPGSNGQYTGATAPHDPFSAQHAAALEAVGETVLQEIGQIDKVELEVVLTGVVGFQQLTNVELSSENGKARVRWTLAQLLQRAGMGQDVAQTDGGVLSLLLFWDCPNLFAPADCLPNLQVTQLAPGVPFYVQWANYYRRAADPSIEYRDLHQARGLRLLVRSKAMGAQVDIQMIMLQISVMLALMPIASMLADTIMQYLFAERRHYREYKVEESPDFSDVRAKVEQLEKQSKSKGMKQAEYA